MNDKIRIRYVLGIGVGDERTHDVTHDRAEWEAMDEDERRQAVDDWANEHIDTGYEELD